MKALRSTLSAALSAAFAAVVLVASPAEARDLYKPFLDPAIPHHRAILDTVEKLKADPKNASLHNDLGCLIAWDGFWRDALREFGEAAALDKKDSRPPFNAGLVRAWKSEWGGAASSFRNAVKRDPGNWTAWWMLGFAEEKLGNVERAVDAYKTSTRVDTSLFDVKVNPFAAETNLRARVLLETHEKRMVRASLPRSEQLADVDRVALLMQKTKAPVATPTPVEKEAVVEAVEEPAPPSGPVVSQVAPPSTSAPPRPAVAPPQRVKPAPPRGESRPQLPRSSVPGEGDIEANRRRSLDLLDGPERVSPGASPIATPPPEPPKEP